MMAACDVSHQLPSLPAPIRPVPKVDRWEMVVVLLQRLRAPAYFVNQIPPGPKHMVNGLKLEPDSEQKLETERLFTESD